MSWGIEIGLWGLLIVASITDLKWGKIYNWINLTFFIGALIFRSYFGGFPEIANAVAASVVGFICFFPLYLLKVMAAGDVKLLTAIGAWTDISSVVRASLIAIVVGGIVGLIVLIKNRGLNKSVQSIAAHLRASNSVKSERIPFAPSLLCAFLLIQIFEKIGWSII